MTFSSKTDVGEIGSVGNPRMGDWSGGCREIQTASVSTMRVRTWLILCRLKKPERVEGYCDVRDSRLRSVEGEVAGFGWKLCFIVCAPSLTGGDCLNED